MRMAEQRVADCAADAPRLEAGVLESLGDVEDGARRGKRVWGRRFSNGLQMFMFREP